MTTIAVGGIQHETNTYSPAATPLDAFIHGGGWPGWQKGAAMLSGLKGMNLPLSGAIDALIEDPRVGHDGLCPLLWAAATPSGKVTDDAFDILAEEMIDRLAAAGKIDGLYLDLHGAMVTASFDDGEGELLRRIRARVGPELPIVVSLDMHANVSRASFDACDAMVVYRTYPHVDMAETGARAARLLLARIERERRWYKTFTSIDFVAPLTAQCTLAEPAASLMAQLVQCEQDALTGGGAEPGLVSLSWACGFPLAAIADARQTVFAYGDDEASVNDAVALLARRIEAARAQFIELPYSPGDAVKEAMRLAATATLPVILCDTNDNPGGGGSSDTTDILRALVEQGARGAVVAMISDPVAAAAAHTGGEGAVVVLPLGGRVPVTGSTPYLGAFEVERVTTGRFVGTGPMWINSQIDLGPMALLRVAGSDVRVIVTSRPMQAGDQSLFRHMGIDPAAMNILSLKSSVHFRADFGAISSAVLVVDAPGACRLPM